MIDWNDLRFFLAAVQAGSYLGAGKKLRVARTTVGRRVDELEKRLGVALYELTPSGYHPTAAGLLVLEAAQRVDTEVLRLVDALTQATRVVQGVLRLASPIEFGEELMQDLTPFLERYPGIQVEIINVSDPVAAVTVRKADIALCVVHAKPSHLMGPLIGPFPFAVYGSSDYLKRAGNSQDVQGHKWVGWNEEFRESVLARWMALNLADQAATGIRVNSWAALKSAVLSGLGVAPMWCAFADQDRRLSKLRGSMPEKSPGLWVLTLKDIPVNACKRAALDFLEPRLKERLQQLAGGKAPSLVRQCNEVCK